MPAVSRRETPKPDDYISLLEAVPLFPSRPHKNSLGRWATRGCYGVRLKTVRFGGKRLTRRVWVEQFNRAVMGASPDVYEETVETSAAHRLAEAKLDAMGIS